MPDYEKLRNYNLKRIFSNVILLTENNTLDEVKTEWGPFVHPNDEVDGGFAVDPSQPWFHFMVELSSLDNRCLGLCCTCGRLGLGVTIGSAFWFESEPLGERGYRHCGPQYNDLQRTGLVTNAILDFFFDQGSVLRVYNTPWRKNHIQNHSEVLKSPMPPKKKNKIKSRYWPDLIGHRPTTHLTAREIR